MVGWDDNGAREPHGDELRIAAQLWSIGVVLLLIWLAGILSSSTVGGFLHLLLPLALTSCTVSLIYRERAAS
jgi:hypothetical protein